MMIALVDCNNFFVSCELTRLPHLKGRPVIVGGNDSGGGCAIAMSNEAKALGIPRGVPLFKVKEIIERHDVAVLQSDHRLYAEISARVMRVLKSFDLKVEVYSVDEAFIHLPFKSSNAEEFCRYVRESVMAQTGIPVGIGISTTKTLAKIAATFAKRHAGYRGVCLMDNCDKIRRGLELTAIGDVWGIGRKTRAKLEQVGIETAAQFAALSREQVERSFSAPVADTWRELKGEYVLGEESHQRRYQTCTCSRTFDHDIADCDKIGELVALYASNVARSLRKHGRLATEVEVFIATNPYKIRLPQRTAKKKIRLDEPSNNTMVITAAAVKIYDEIFAEGYCYKRAGVSAVHTIGEGERQADLFADTRAIERGSRLMEVLDKLNARGHRVRLAAEAGKSVCEDNKKSVDLHKNQ